MQERWSEFWRANETYKVSNDSPLPKYYVLDMFPYPSGAGLHVGHPLGYIASDIVARYQRMRGYNVLHPMGFDAFGLPAEQYAIETGVHPAVSTAKNIAGYRKQLDNIGLGYDWDRAVTTSDPQYYKWTQWIFVQLFEHYYDTGAGAARPIAELEKQFATSGTADIAAFGAESLTFDAAYWNGLSALERSDVLMNYRLAYRKLTYVNWCEALGTVLANDEVKDGKSERGGYDVEQRPMLQWSLRITAYAQRLLDSLETLDWSDSMKKMQANWIGRSTGAQLFFDVKNSPAKIEVYTTRPDTIYGATYMVLAPEHELVAALTTDAQRAEIEAYQAYAGARSERDRLADVKEVTGAFTGAYAINPFTQTEIPIWIGDYVLKDYGTGAIMAVPSDDDRDHRFAEKFGLEIIEVIDKSAYPGSTRADKEGIMINSGALNGMEVPAAIAEATRRIEEMGIGTGKVNYRLRDAIYSRQRYWGEPFPIVYDADGVPHALPEEALPVELPELENFKPAGGGQSPLARVPDWVTLSDGRTRETDTMPGFAGSSWYFLRYMDPHNDEHFAGPEALAYWQDVDLYVGGTEHAVGHLLYSRFWHKFLFDKGLVPTEEPFKRLINQGMIQGESFFVTTYDCAPAVTDGAPIVTLCAGPDTFDDEHTVSYLGMPYRVQRDEKSRKRIPAGLFEFRTGIGAVLPAANIDRLISEYPKFYEGFQREQFVLDVDEQGQGFVRLFSEVEKMSKSKYNVVNPDDLIARYGADCLRMYEMFLGPVEQSKPWDIQGIDGVSKFLRRFYDLFYNGTDTLQLADGPADAATLKIVHTCLKKVNTDIERFSFNTCVSAFMVATNELRKQKTRNRAALTELVLALAPFAPFLAEELYHALGFVGSVHQAAYPQADETHLKEDAVEYPVSINGKMRFKATFPSAAGKQEIELAVPQLEPLQKWVAGKAIRRIIVVPGRMINVVV